MCGILFILSYDEDRVAEDLKKYLLPLLQNRGPDSYDAFSIDVNTSKGRARLSMHGTVLSLRGKLTNQPLVSKDDNIFLWNGEIFGGGITIPENMNDTLLLFQSLEKIPFNHPDHHLELISIFSKIQGPWAFVFYDAVNMNLWYGRDYFGRRSLMSYSRDNLFALSSVGHRIFQKEFTEVPAKALYCINLKELDSENIGNHIKTYNIPLYYSFSNRVFDKHMVHHRCVTDSKLTNLNDVVSENISISPNSSAASELSLLESTVCYDCQFSRESNKGNLEINICDPKSKDLERFSDGDVFADIQNVNDHICKENVVTKSERRTCCMCLHSSSEENLLLNDDSRYVADDHKSDAFIKDNSPNSFCELPISGDGDFMTIEAIQQQFSNTLEEAVRKRVTNLPRSNSNFNGSELKASKVGILFSGGIDSVILTYLADKCTPLNEPIDLINVAFAQKQKTQQNVKKKYQKSPMESTTLNFNVPDRLTGRIALKELPKQRKWNFIEVDITLEELQKTRKSNITNLVYPLDSVLDDSIGCAIWFAARGVGKRFILSAAGEMQLVEENYRSPVKVLLTGMGADEQLGGYARHRSKFESSGWLGLSNEMKMELERISTRNLGRDDRCISDHGREARFPFLDENVVSFLKDLPVCVKCDPRLPRGEGEKILLREVALSLGLPFASKLPKRAIQFGSKIAKLESCKEKGSDNCKRLELLKAQ